jgi:RsiW-degrading membrane proteinase PrsW (M82 family)
MLIIFSVLAAIIPMLVYLFLIWRFDKYDREPVSLVLLNYFWGAFGAIILTLILESLAHLFISSFEIQQTSVDYLGSVLTAPVIEEVTKGFFLLIMIKNRNFDNITDGVVYGGAIGLGFGMTENLMYFIANSSSAGMWLFVVIVRTLFSAVMHCVATGNLGIFLAYAKYKNMSQKIIYGVIGLIIAMLIHAAWNTFVSLESTAWNGVVFMISAILVFILVFIFSVIGEKKIIYSELFEETQSGLIPFEHLHVINSPQRNKPGWVDEGIRKLYIAAAITLAFKKVQHKNSSGVNKNYLETEIDKLRNSIAVLLGKN